MVPSYGYVLEDSDYPEVPIVVGYEGEWEWYDDEITEDIVITAQYYEADPHTVTFHITYPSSSSSMDTNVLTPIRWVTRTISVPHGYVLQDEDYPTMPTLNGYSSSWERYWHPVLDDITVEGHYSQTIGIDPPPIGGGEIMSTGTTIQSVGSSTDDYTPARRLVSTTTQNYTYLYLGGTLRRMTRTTTVTAGSSTTTTTDTLYFSYDVNGVPLTLTQNGTKYNFVTNLQGDVVGLVNGSGTRVVSYTYDAWGELQSVTGSLASTLGEINPLRYRGYVYDTELSYYYLQSRYYNPEVGRFINADDTANLGAEGEINSQNLFAYCLNNPINRTDESGNWSLPNWATKVIIGTAVIAAAAVLTVATAGTGTALACFAVGALKGAAIGAAVGAASGAATGAVTHRITTGSWEGAGQAALEGAADGYMTGAITGFISGGINSNACFIAGTVVLAEIGEQAIETIQPGDMVWAWDEETGDVALKEVVETYINETDELVHVFVNGEEIVTTPSHPFYSPVKGWTSAVHLRAGDILVLVNGEYVVVEKVQHEILESPIKVYNFQVADYHTYYVANIGVLVHNTCRGDAVKKAWKSEQELVKTTGRGSRDWTSSQIEELLNTGKVKGFVGHHMKSVKGFPELAGDPSNIQFLTRTEHFLAHGGNWRNITYGRFIA